MDSEIEFKFNPVYVTVLFLVTSITASGFYVIYSDFFNLNIATILFLCLLPIVIGLTAIPKFLRMVTGIPAITLTNDYLVDNTNGVTINWNDISEAKIIRTARGPGAIAITLKQPEKYFNTFTKKTRYYISKFFSKNHIIIYYSLIIEKDNSLFLQINQALLR